MILADGNLLVAFNWATHVNYDRASKFFAANPKVATCPITELNLLRVLMQLGLSGADADKILQTFISDFRSRLIADDISATEISGLNAGHLQQRPDSYFWPCWPKNYSPDRRHFGRTFTANRFPGLVELVSDKIGKKS